MTHCPNASYEDFRLIREYTYHITCEHALVFI